MWWGIYKSLCYKFPTESNNERILKIGKYLVKLWATVRCLVFLTHGVVLTVILCKRLVDVYMFRVDVRETRHISKYNDYNTTVQPHIFLLWNIYFSRTKERNYQLNEVIIRLIGLRTISKCRLTLDMPLDDQWDPRSWEGLVLKAVH